MNRPTPATILAPVLALAAVALLAACASASSPSNTATRQPTVASSSTLQPTSTPIATPTIAIASPTGADSPTATPLVSSATPVPPVTPAPTVTPQPTATPAPKLPWSIPADQPDGFLSFDEAKYLHFEQTIEGTTVEVAFSKELDGNALISGFPAMSPDDYADLVFQTFARHRSIFGDFAYDRYRVVVRGPSDDPLGYFITNSHGLDIAFGDFDLGSSTQRFPPHGVTEEFAHDWTVHEIFHAWNGQFIRPRPTGDELIFQAETWLSEGATVYFTARNGDEDFFLNMIESAEDFYRAHSDLAHLSFADIAAQTLPPDGSGGPPPANDAVTMLFKKGPLVAYFLDAELRNHGSSLDELMSNMFVRFGRTDTKYVNDDVRGVAVELGGPSLNDFFDKYVDGPDELPFEGKYQHFSPA